MEGYLDRRLAGKLGGLLFVGSGALSAVTLPLPQPEGIDRLAVLLSTLVAVTIGGLAFVFPWHRLHPKATLVLVPIAFVLISAANHFGNAQPYTYALFFIVVFVWIGLAHPVWTSTWILPLAAIAYGYPLLLRPGDFGVSLASTALVIPVCALVGESIAWVGAREERSRRRTLALAHVAQALGPHLNVDAVARSLVHEVRSALNSPVATLVLLDASKVISSVYSSGLSAQLREAFHQVEGVPLADNPGIEALARGEPEVVEDAKRGAELLPEPESFGIRSYLAIPVLVEDELVGILSSGNPTPRRYGPDDIVLARALANQASAAIRNATLYEKTHQAALLDPLTGLGNRRAFHDRLTSEITRAQRYSRPLSLIVLDVDGLKPINDASGHLAGDRALERLSRLIEDNARREDGVFRVGGDEFALVLPETPPGGATIVGERIRRAVRRAHVGEGTTRPLTASVGVASFPEHGLSLEELFERADAALYEVKFAGGDAVALATDRSSPDDAIHLGVNVASVISGRRLVPLYQPIVDLGTATVIGYEAFCRLDERVTSTPTPTLFRAASVVGLNAELDRCCHEVALAGAGGLADDVRLFLNVSPTALASDAFDPHELLAAIRMAGLGPERVVLELTEPRDEWSDTMIDNLQVCRGDGLELALDGFAAKSHDIELIGRIPIRHLKVNLGYIRGIEDRRSSEQVLRAVLEAARTSDAEVIAEGIESLDDLEIARKLGFDAVQGFFIKDPGPGFEAPKHLDLLRSG